MFEWMKRQATEFDVYKNELDIFRDTLLFVASSENSKVFLENSNAKSLSNGEKDIKVTYRVLSNKDNNQINYKFYFTYQSGFYKAIISTDEKDKEKRISCVAETKKDINYFLKVYSQTYLELSKILANKNFSNMQTEFQRIVGGVFVKVSEKKRTSGPYSGFITLL